MKRILYCGFITALFLVISTSLFSEEIAVLPYLVQNPSSTFEVSAGDNYSKLIAVGASVKKGFSLYPYSRLQRDLKNFSIVPSTVVTAEDLSLLAKTREIDFIVTGTLVKLEDGYMAKSILYSRSSGKVITESSVRGETLIELAQLDIDRLFMYHRDLQSSTENIPVLESSFIIDNSIFTAMEIPGIKNGIIRYASTIINMSPGSSIGIYPLSDQSYRTSSRMVNVFDVENQLKVLSPQRDVADSALTDILHYKLNNFRWKPDTQKEIFIITNRDLQRNAEILRMVTRATLMNVKIHVIMLGRVSREANILYSEISEKTSGQAFNVTYTQELVDHRGNSYYLYFENARLFTADTRPSAWSSGVLQYTGRSRASSVRPVDYVSELQIYGNLDYSSLERYYKREGSRTVIQSKDVLNNVEFLFRKLSSENVPSSGNRVVARVMLSHFDSTIWVNVYSAEDLAFFRNKMDVGHSFMLGVRVFRDQNATYGFEFGRQFAKNFEHEQVPNLIKTNLTKIISDSDNFRSGGFLDPPLWFLDLKVEQIREVTEKQDVRIR